jgi:two-component system chemotaxis sensor kinase CheA
VTNVDDFKKTYFEECAELLDELYAQLTNLAEQRADDETMHAIFRAVHSIKGGGGAFGFDRLVAFAHVFETLLDLMRDGRVAVTPEVIALLQRATDTLSDIIDAARTGREIASGFEDELAAALREAAGGAGTSAAQHAPQRPAAEGGGDPAVPCRYRIRFRPRMEMFLRANEPLLVIRDLKRLGKVTVEADLSRLPDLAALEPEQAYLAWTLEVETAAAKAAVEEVFEFVSDDCELTIESETAVPVSGRAPAGERPAERAMSQPPGAGSPNGSSSKPGARIEGVQSIRVDVDKVDRVVNLVGELVINQSMLIQFSRELPIDTASALINGIETLSQNLRELQESIMAMRAQPVKSVFMRMPRLVRELAAQLGKEAHLVITGEATEIDKTVIEQLADPLTHLLRNALDHGIESPEERRAQGKPPKGTIHLGAEHRSGRIVIEIADDGRGIDRERVLAKAQSRGLVAPGASLTDEEIDNLIFVPGFSTADNVSNISGRGVGMDVVKRNVQALGGRVTVESSAGSGSRFILSLPLTLAVLDGMVVAAGKETYIVPLTNIVESLRPKPADIHPVVDRGDVLAIRGAYVPLVYLHRCFAVPDAVTDPCLGIVVIVESEGGKRIGIVVDQLLGQQQVVVKSIEANYDSIDGVGGATILGNGRVALILDISRLRDVQRQPASRRSSRSETLAFVSSSPGIQ